MVLKLVVPMQFILLGRRGSLAGAIQELVLVDDVVNADRRDAGLEVKKFMLELL